MTLEQLKARLPAPRLGISLGDRRLGVVLMERSREGPRVLRGGQFAMSLDVLKDDPELVGRELRDHLEDMGIHARRCIVCLPAKWFFTTRTELPAIDGDDAASFLELQAEKNLPFAPGDHVPLDLMKKAVKGGAAPHDAVWSGASLGLARLKGRSIMFRILGRDAF